MTAQGFALACALLLLSAGSAYAQDYARDGFYVGLAGSLGIDAAVEDEIQKIGIGADVDEALGLHARVGYRFHPRISAELHFEWLDEADISLQGVSLGKDAFSLERLTFTADAKAHLLTGPFQPFLLVGVGLARIELEDSVGFGISVTDTDFAARFGGGIEVYTTENIVVNLEASYVLPTGDLNDFDYISIGWGLQYRF